MRTARYVTLDSQAGSPVGDRTDAVRFHLPSPLRGVASVRWLSFEVQQDHALSLRPGSNALYFSEGLAVYRAELPTGSYTKDTLQGAIEAAMACAAAIEGEPVAVQNTYAVSVLPDSARVCIASDGFQPFALHTFRAAVRLQSLRLVVTDPAEAHATLLWPEPEPMARGALVDIFCPRQAPVRAQVLHALGQMLHVRALRGRPFEEGVSAAAAVGDAELRPVSHDTALPELLGLGTRDLASDLAVPIASLSSPFSGGRQHPPHRRPMHVGLRRAHGCLPGDVVRLENLGPGLPSGKAVVQRVISEQQLELGVDLSYLGDGWEAVSLDGGGGGGGESWPVARSAIVGLGAYELTCKLHFAEGFVQKDTCKLPPDWRPVSLRDPVPSAEWKAYPVHARRGPAADVLLLRLRIPPRAAARDALLRRSCVVAPRRMNLLHKKSVLLLRLFMEGRTEAGGVVVVALPGGPAPIQTFGRAQMRPSGFLTADGLALVGASRFDPPLERVAFLDAVFLTAQGVAMPPDALGDYSLLLEIVAAP